MFQTAFGLKAAQERTKPNTIKFEPYIGTNVFVPQNTELVRGSEKTLEIQRFSINHSICRKAQYAPLITYFYEIGYSVFSAHCEFNSTFFDMPLGKGRSDLIS